MVSNEAPATYGTISRTGLVGKSAAAAPAAGMPPSINEHANPITSVKRTFSPPAANRFWEAREFTRSSRRNRHLALDLGSVKRARVFIVVRCRAMERAAVVPDQHVSGLPLVRINELAARSECFQLVDELPRGRVLHSQDA